MTLIRFPVPLMIALAMTANAWDTASILNTNVLAGQPIENSSLPQSPVSPRDSLRWMEKEPGFQIELVAAEPQIVDPVSMQIDEQGRMWVVEMRDYPSEDSTPKSRIIVLEDKDGDGSFESSNVFADKLLFATGVQPWQNGAIVTVAGQLLMLRDTDGDLRADTTEVWLEGFSIGNPQLRANHPTITADGWLTVASGLRGGKLTASLPFGNPTSESIDLAGCDLRVHLLTGRVESIAGPTQFGLSFDQFGNRYGCSNRQPCFEILSERSNLSLSPLSGLAPAIHEVSPGEASSRVFPLVNAWTTSNLHAGQFTAACGVLVTHSRHFPEAPYATVLTCEPTGSLVQRRSMVRLQGRSGIVEESSKTEWLASRDPWFRPVDLYEGPNGDVYVVDMYRAVIEHPEWVPAELKNRPDQRFGNAHGRIYRVSRADSPVSKTRSVSTADRLLQPTAESLTAWLQHPDAWNRSVAARLVLEQFAAGSRDAMLEILREQILQPRSDLPVGATATACDLLASVDSLDEQAVRNLLQRDMSLLRTKAWIALSRSSSSASKPWIDEAIEAIENPVASLEERRAAAWYVASLQDRPNQSIVQDSPQAKRFTEAAAKSVIANCQDNHLWMAVTAASRTHLDLFLSSYLSRVTDPSSSSDLAWDTEPVLRLASRFAMQSRPVEIANWVERCTQEIVSNAHPQRRKTCYAILGGIARVGKLKIEPDSPLERLVQTAAESDADTSDAGTSDTVLRRAAISLLSASQSESSKAMALKLLATPDAGILKVAIATCAVHNTPEFSEWLLDRLPTALPDVKQELFNAIRNHPSRLAAMVERLEQKRLSIRVFDASQIQSLRSVRVEEMGTRLSKVFAESVNADRQGVIDLYSQGLVGSQIDPANNQGKVLFAKNCAACHRLDGVGTAVGPDISDSREQSFEKLLIAVLDPNRSIDANYFRYLARTQDGSVVEGLLKDSNAQTISLAGQNGISTTIRRGEIEELKSSGASLMPEGIESQVSAREMADLLWYVKNWRYLADGVPANAVIGK